MIRPYPLLPPGLSRDPLHPMLLLFGITFIPPLFLVLSLRQFLNRKIVDRNIRFTGRFQLYLVFISGIIGPAVLTVALLNLYYHEPIGFQLYSVLITAELTLMVAIFFAPLVLLKKQTELVIFPKPPLLDLVSVIIPVHNEEAKIAILLDSLRATNYYNKQIIVVDDGSTDNTFTAAQMHSRYFPPHSYSVTRNKLRGKSHTVNHGIMCTVMQIASLKEML